MRHDLESIFKRIKILKNKLLAKHPKEYKIGIVLINLFIILNIIFNNFIDQSI